MSLFLWNILLAFIYISISDNFTPSNFLAGMILGYIVLWFSHRDAKSSKYFKGFWQVLRFTLFYLREFFMASLRIAWDVITPGHRRLRPGIIAVPLDAKTDAEINLLANLITLTPGGISLDVSTDKKVLYVYEIYLDKEGKRERAIKEELEKRVLEVMR